jgi:hypothetical protein
MLSNMGGVHVGLICSGWDPFGIRVEIPFKPMDLGCTSMSTYQIQFKKYMVVVNNIFVTKVSPRKLCFVSFLLFLSSGYFFLGLRYTQIFFLFYF